MREIHQSQAEILGHASQGGDLLQSRADGGGGQYWFVAESEAEAVMTMVYGMAPASSSTLMTRAMFDCFWPTPT